MLTQLLRRSGYDVRELNPESLMTTPGVLRNDYDVIYISSISPFAVAKARSLCRKLAAAFPGVRIVVGLWNFDHNVAQQRLGPGCSCAVVNTLAEALAQVRQDADVAFAEPSSGDTATANPALVKGERNPEKSSHQENIPA
jgi:hypothetical protein